MQGMQVRKRSERKKKERNTDRHRQQQDSSRHDSPFRRRSMQSKQSSYTNTGTTGTRDPSLLPYLPPDGRGTRHADTCCSLSLSLTADVVAAEELSSSLRRLSRSS